MAQVTRGVRAILNLPLVYEAYQSLVGATRVRRVIVQEYLRTSAGQALLDVGCYGVSVARWILGEPSKVLARSRMHRGVDMTTSALLEFPGGQTAAVWASFESPEEQELTVVTRGETHRVERPFTSMDPDPYQLMVESFAESVFGDRPVAIPLSESIANMRALDLMRASAGI